jgi:hypothetical protein
MTWKTLAFEVAVFDRDPLARLVVTWCDSSFPIFFLL